MQRNKLRWHIKIHWSKWRIYQIILVIMWREIRSQFPTSLFPSVKSHPSSWHPRGPFAVIWLQIVHCVEYQADPRESLACCKWSTGNFDCEFLVLFDIVRQSYQIQCSTILTNEGLEVLLQSRPRQIVDVHFKCDGVGVRRKHLDALRGRNILDISQTARQGRISTNFLLHILTWHLLPTNVEGGILALQGSLFYLLVCIRVVKSIGIFLQPPMFQLRKILAFTADLSVKLQ